jgi:hypothetical protein
MEKNARKKMATRIVRRFLLLKTGCNLCSLRKTLIRIRRIRRGDSNRKLHGAFSSHQQSNTTVRMQKRSIRPQPFLC